MMIDYTLVIVSMVQTIVLLYVASRLNKIHRMLEKLTMGLIRLTSSPPLEGGEVQRFFEICIRIRL